MPRTTHRSVLRSHGGGTRKATPGTVPMHLQLKADCGLTTKQIIGRLALNNRIIDVRRIGPPAGFTEASAGTFQMDLEATTSPVALSGVSVVASGTALPALGSKTVAAASFGLCFAAERDISVTIAGGTAGQTAWFSILVLPHDDGGLT